MITRFHKVSNYKSYPHSFTQTKTHRTDEISLLVTEEESNSSVSKRENGDRRRGSWVVNVYEHVHDLFHHLTIYSQVRWKDHRAFFLVGRHDDISSCPFLLMFYQDWNSENIFTRVSCTRVPYWRRENLKNHLKYEKILNENICDGYTFQIILFWCAPWILGLRIFLQIFSSKRLFCLNFGENPLTLHFVFKRRKQSEILNRNFVHNFRLINIDSIYNILIFIANTRNILRNGYWRHSHKQQVHCLAADAHQNSVLLMEYRQWISDVMSVMRSWENQYYHRNLCTKRSTLQPVTLDDLKIKRNQESLKW